ncbi:hypothetical protein B0H10DRAFT_1779900, partial [Mycena sp. CBHHK59/15]
IQQYTENASRVLVSPLPYESRPSESLRPSFKHGSPIVMIAHCAQDRAGDHKVTVSSGFAHAAPGAPDGGPLVLSCAHPLEEARSRNRYSHFAAHQIASHMFSGSFVVSGAATPLFLKPVSRIMSALPRSDLILMQSAAFLSSLPSLPVSPYSAPPNTAIRAHCVTHERPTEPGWWPWVDGTWSKWVRGTVLGYRDFAGRETKTGGGCALIRSRPGTYDSLSDMLFSPLPTAGSSGATRQWVGRRRAGTRMDNRVEL